MLFVSVLLLVHPLTLLQFLFFSLLTVPSLISIPWLLYSCRYGVNNTINSLSLPLCINPYPLFFPHVHVHTHMHKGGGHSSSCTTVRFWVGWGRRTKRQTCAGISLYPLLSYSFQQLRNPNWGRRRERGWL